MRDVYQELANVSMGQAADLLARLLNAFVVLPIPNVNVLEVSELHMALSYRRRLGYPLRRLSGLHRRRYRRRGADLFHDSSFRIWPG